MIPKLEVDGVSYSYHSLDGETLALPLDRGRKPA